MNVLAAVLVRVRLLKVVVPDMVALEFEQPLTKLTELVPATNVPLFVQFPPTCNDPEPAFKEPDAAIETLPAC